MMLVGLVGLHQNICQEILQAAISPQRWRSVTMLRDEMLELWRERSMSPWAACSWDHLCHLPVQPHLGCQFNSCCDRMHDQSRDMNIVCASSSVLASPCALVPSSYTNCGDADQLSPGTNGACEVHAACFPRHACLCVKARDPPSNLHRAEQFIVGARCLTCKQS